MFYVQAVVRRLYASLGLSRVPYEFVPRIEKDKRVPAGLSPLLLAAFERMSISVGQVSGTAEIFRGGEAGKLAEIVDEVCLVGVAKLEGELRTVEWFPGVKTFQQFMQAEAADNPLRRDAYIVLE